MNGTRHDIATALLERIRVLIDGWDIAVLDHYEQSLVESHAGVLYVSGIEGRIEHHGGASDPFRRRDEFTIDLELGGLAGADDGGLVEISATVGRLIDIVIAAVSTCWDPNDDRTRLVEEGAELQVNGPNPGYWGDPTAGRLTSWADISIDLARQIQFTAEEAR